MYFVLSYDYVPDVLARRAPHRAEHLAKAQALHAAGKIVLAGAFDPPTDGAMFVFRADSAAEVEDFVRSDPYVRSGVVTAHRIRPWNVVVGG
jgi:uncharacterized protein YciI